MGLVSKLSLNEGILLERDVERVATIPEYSIVKLSYGGYRRVRKDKEDILRIAEEKGANAYVRFLPETTYDWDNGHVYALLNVKDKALLDEYVQAIEKLREGAETGRHMFLDIFSLE